MIKIPTLHVRATSLEVRASELPAGVCGQVTGIALRYNVVDSYGTLFLPGSLDKTRAKVTAGKVKLFDNHGAADWYGTRTHIGVVRSLTTAGDAEVMVADLFDTEDGRRAKEYLAAVMAAGGETGLSIGFYEREGESVRDAQGNWQHYAFEEIELDEISLAPRQAVPGAEVTNVRKRTGHAMPKPVVVELLRAALRGQTDDEVLALIRETRADTDAADDESSDGDDTADNGRDERRSDADSPALATMDDRLLAVRQSYAIT